MAGRMDGLRVAFLAAPEGTERLEVTEPWEAVRRERDPSWCLPEAGEGRFQPPRPEYGTMPVTADRPGSGGRLGHD